MKTLLTGFGPFGSVVNNPSARIVEQLATTGAPGHELTARVLPVSYARAAQEISALLREGVFDAALLMGVAQGESGLRLEQVARRPAVSGHPDVDGLVPALDGVGMELPETLACGVRLDRLLARLHEATLPARLSNDAGGYVCNHTYYAALAAVRNAGLPTCCLFIHVPPDEMTWPSHTPRPTLALTHQIYGIQIALEWIRTSIDDVRASQDRLV